jgi:hypothetical protein
MNTKLSQTMEPKYRTLLQAALLALVIAITIISHTSDKGDQALAQETGQAHR